MIIEDEEEQVPWTITVEYRGKDKRTQLYSIDGYKTLRDAWDEIERDLIHMAWLGHGSVFNRLATVLGCGLAMGAMFGIGIGLGIAGVFHP